MTTPPPKEEKDPGVRLLARLVVSLVFWFGSFLAANWILSSEPQNAALRAGAVALAVAGFVPWIWMASRAIVAQDEYRRRIHYIALSWAFAATGVFVVASDLLVRAHFIDYLSIMNIWIFMIVAWWVSMMLTARYHR